MPVPSSRPTLNHSRLFGIETEYGIWVEGRGAHDLMEESRLLVRAYQGPYAGPWDYRAEAPRTDMRGFQVAHLNFNEEDAQYDRDTPSIHLTSEEQRSDRALPNGARLYNDHGHPEYSTPECRTLRDLVAHDRAGERVLLELAHRRTEETGRQVRIFKNNTDYHGISYGTHEGYLCDREVPFDRLFHGMLPFLVTRILYCGSGKTGVETDGPFRKECAYQISQRADFFTEEASVDTLAKRPIFNTRDEAHADARRFRRLHVINGDATLSQFATALKAGTASAVLSLIEAGWEPLFRLRDPVNALKKVSRDPTWRWVLELEDGRTMRATDLQRIYLRDAQQLLAGSSPDMDWTLREWERVLDDLDAMNADRWRLEDRLDWVAKRRLLESFIEAEGLEAEGHPWESDTIRALDLEFHDVDPEIGLFHALDQAGQMVRLVDEGEAERAMTAPPSNTRAAVRGALIRRFGREVARVSWGRLSFREPESRWTQLPAELDATSVADLLSGLDAVKTAAEAQAFLADGQSRYVV